MPEPQTHESLAAFISRYMGSERARKDFPAQKQRAAVAYAEWREKRKKAKRA